eukprot:c149_g1_i1.p2 GENE.c149_g1_i1~~c149_g1_i1.p2  ORF type:complete len:124 (-),score=35.46 c149_g1_i1:256-627(-)
MRSYRTLTGQAPPHVEFPRAVTAEEIAAIFHEITDVLMTCEENVRQNIPVRPDLQANSKLDMAVLWERQSIAAASRVLEAHQMSEPIFELACYNFIHEPALREAWRDRETRLMKTPFFSTMMS